MTQSSRTIIAVIVLTATLVPLAQAEPDYRCVIERAVVPQGESSKATEQLLSNYIGKEFTVERRTGLIAGILKNSYMTKPQVIDIGNEENAYKVVTTMRRDEGFGAGSNIYALNILEYERAQKKPFVFLRNEEVFIGTCEHF